MGNKTLDRIREIIYRELDSIPDDPQLTYDCLCMIDKLVDILKDSYEIEEKESMMSSYEDGFSRGGYSMGNNGYSNGSNRMIPRYYYDGNSYNGGGGYSNNGGNNSYGRGGSYGNRGGYSREDAKHDMVNKLEQLMNDTHDERDREAIRRMLDQMR